MKIKNFDQLNETDTNQILGTQLNKYFDYYKMWCGENGEEYNFENTPEDEIVAKGAKYAKEHNLPNMFYYTDS